MSTLSFFRIPRAHSARSHFLVLIVPLLLSACALGDRSSKGDSETPDRLVSLVPTVTETLFALGAGARVVAVSDFDNYPPQTKRLPRVGALVNPNFEKILALQPDLVFTYGTQSLLQQRLAAAGIQQFSVVTGNIDEVLESIRNVGRAIGLGDDGDRLASQIRESMDALRASAASARPRVLLVHSREVGTMGGFYTAGSRSYFNELIEIGGGDNIFAEVDQNVFQPSLEEILDRAPEVIVELLPSDRDRAAIAQRLSDWQALDSLPAVRDGRVHILTGDHLLLVGPRLHIAAADLARAIRDPGPPDILSSRWIEGFGDSQSNGIPD